MAFSLIIYLLWYSEKVESIHFLFQPSGLRTQSNKIVSYFRQNFSYIPPYLIRILILSPLLICSRKIYSLTMSYINICGVGFSEEEDIYLLTLALLMSCTYTSYKSSVPTHMTHVLFSNNCDINPKQLHSKLFYEFFNNNT